MVQASEAVKRERSDLSVSSPVDDLLQIAKLMGCFCALGSRVLPNGLPCGVAAIDRDPFMHPTY